MSGKTPGKKLERFKEPGRSYDEATKRFVTTADVSAKARARAAEADPEVARDYRPKGSTPRSC